MPEIRPFRGVRYDLARVGSFSSVVAPPYDVIDGALQQRLYDLSPFNAIRFELNKDEPGDARGNDRYARAARCLADWRKQGVLVDEPRAALYVCHQTYEVDGQSHTRRGFLARVRLEPFGSGKIYAHEQTLSGPKADRLALYKATGFNLSPVFGIYPDARNEVLAALEAGIRDKTPIEATDHLGVISRLWPVYDAEAHTAAVGLIAASPVFIADGHHRYETALRYRDDLAAAGELSGPDDPANFALMMLVSMNDPGLLILPTHRLASGLGNLTAPRLIELLAPEFEIEAIGEGESACRACGEAIELHGDQDMLAFGTTADQRWITARLRSGATMARIVTDHSAEWSSLGVSILHELVFKRLLSGVGTAEFAYVHQVNEALQAVQGASCDLACLVPAARMEHVEVIASNLEKMPPKSTYFYPKLLTGLVLNPLRA